MTSPSYLTTARYTKHIAPSEYGYSVKTITEPQMCIGIQNHYCWIQVPKYKDMGEKIYYPWSRYKSTLDNSYVRKISKGHRQMCHDKLSSCLAARYHGDPHNRGIQTIHLQSYSISDEFEGQGRQVEKHIFLSLLSFRWGSFVASLPQQIMSHDGMPWHSVYWKWTFSGTALSKLINQSFMLQTASLTFTAFPPYISQLISLL